MSFDYWESDEHLLADPDIDWWQSDHDGFDHWEPDDG